MSETPFQPAPQTETLPGHETVPEAISLDSIEAIRQQERKAHWARTLSIQSGTDHGSQTLSNRYDEIVDAHLRAHGITQDDERYQEYFDFLRERSVDQIGNEWEVGDKAADGSHGIARREETARYFRSRYPRSVAGTESDPITDEEGEVEEGEPVVEEESEQERKKENLEQLAAVKHAAFAEKVNGPAWGKGKKELQAKYDEAEAAYLAAVRQQIEADLAANGYRDDQMRDYIIEQVNARAKDDVEKQYAAILAQGGKKAELMARYANLSTGKKIGVTLGIGAGAALLGLAGGAILAAPAAVAALSLGVRFGRGYANQLSKIYKKDETVPTFDESKHTDAYEYLSGVSQDKIKQAERIKKRAVFSAVGAVAIGGALGTASHVAIDHITDYTESNSHWAGGYIQHIPGVGSLDAPEIDGSEVTPPRSDDLPTPPDLTPEQPPKPDTTPDVDRPIVNFGRDERMIESGEGWYNTFREMGVKSSGQAELLKEVGPKLEDRGLAYWDNNAKEWRMNMTENGKLPRSAITYIAETAHKQGIHTNYEKYLDVSADTDTTDTTETHNYSSAAETIERGEGYYQTLNEMGVEDTADQIKVLDEAAPELLKEDGSYKMRDGNPGILMTEDGKMPEETLNILHDAAVQSGVDTDATVDHDGIMFDEAADTASETTGTNGEFHLSDIGKSYDVDAKAYYGALKDVDRAHWQDVMKEIAPKLQTIHIDGKPLAYPSSEGWKFQSLDKLPPQALNAIKAVANKRDWTLAA